MRRIAFLVLALVAVGAGPPEGGYSVGIGPREGGRHERIDGGHHGRITPGPHVLHAQQHDDIGSPRAGAPLTILQLNDVYSTLPVDGAGGLARVATLKRQLAAEGRTPFLMLAGDFLSSSVASTVFQGEQMIAALNAAGLDLATLGNHEFDFGPDVLIQRMREARWEWVVSNVLDARTGKPIGGAAPYVLKTFGTLKVGFIGLCLASDGLTKDRLGRIRLIDPVEAAATYVPILKKEQAQVIVALTHLSFAEDRALAERFPEIDLIVGGHEHFPITAFEGRTLISKSGSDAKVVARIDVLRRETGAIARFHELIPMTSSFADEPETAKVVAAYEARLGPELDKPVGSAGVPLVGVASRLRASETNLGNLVADALRAEARSDVALVNAGGIRGDRVHPPGPLTRRALIEIHPFGNVVCTLSVLGRVIVQALEHGVSRLPAAAGQFPQVSGLSFQVDSAAPAGQRIRGVRVGDAALDPARTYTVAIPDFLLLGGDGYTMFASETVVVGPEDGPLMALALEKQVAGKEVAPRVEQRIVIDSPR
jgi:5'-nucleotidase